MRGRDGSTCGFEEEVIHRFLRAAHAVAEVMLAGWDGKNVVKKLRVFEVSDQTE